MTAPRERRLPWLALAALLHGALWWGVAAGPAPLAPAVVPPVEVGHEIELETGEPASVVNPLASAAGQGAAESRREPSASSGAQAERVRGARPERGAAVDTALDASAADGGEVERDDAPLASASAGESESSTAQRLSPEALGIGPTNPFAGQAATRRELPARRPARAAGTSRFQRALAGEIVRADQSRGLGPEGPVLTELETIVRRGDAALNSTARFRFTTDAEGRLVSAELLSSSSDPAPFRRHAEAVLEALRSQKLRIPKTGRGVTFVVRVESRVQMPSGADPGLAVNILGVPVKKGEGPRSARIDILNLVPKLEVQEERLPSGQTVSVPNLNVGNVLSMMGDLSDVGAKAQRMVHAHVERIGAGDVAD